MLGPALFPQCSLTPLNLTRRQNFCARKRHIPSVESDSSVEKRDLRSVCPLPIEVVPQLELDAGSVCVGIGADVEGGGALRLQVDEFETEA